MGDVRPPQLQATIVAHLRAAKTPVTSRDLAARYLLIRGPDEATCHRLLAPILSEVRGVLHDPAAGWRFEARAAAAAGAAAPADAAAMAAANAGPGDPAGAAAPSGEAATPDAATTADESRLATPWDRTAGPQSLVDIVAIAVDGVGPGGSGHPRALTYLPVIGGEEMQEEHLPAWGLDTDGTVAPGYDLEDEAGAGGPPEAGAAGFAGAPGLTTADLEDLAEAVGDLPVVCHRAGRETEPLRRTAEAAGVPFQPRVLSAARLGHLLLGLKANHAAADLARALRVEAPGPDDCRGRARLVARAWLRIVPLLAAKGITSVDAALEYQDLPAAPLDLTGYAFTADDLRALPATPGVYRFLDRDGRVIYIGKAKNLRSRVGSYFVPGARGTAKGRAILERAYRFVIEPVGSELEAILLEAALIQEHRPPLNRQFEVHERPAPFGPRRNLVVATADADAPTCTLHLLRDGRYHQRIPGLDAPPGGPEGWARVATAVESIYYAGGGAGGEEIDWALVSSYLRRHRDTTQALDVDEAPSAKDALDRIAVLAAAAIAGGPRVHPR